jgi:uncharacterized membrane protein
MNSDPKISPPASASASRILKRIGLSAVFLWFLIGGVAHFTATDIEMRIVPPAIPWPRATVLISGVFELLGAAGILIPATRRAAGIGLFILTIAVTPANGIGLFILTIAVTPANIYMLQHAELFNVPRWALILRLPFQVALLALILWCTKAMARAPNPASTANLQ